MLDEAEVVEEGQWSPLDSRDLVCPQAPNIAILSDGFGTCLLKFLKLGILASSLFLKTWACHGFTSVNNKARLQLILNETLDNSKLTLVNSK